MSAENQERHMENITTVIECPNENGKTEEKKKENKYLVIVLLYIRMLWGKKKPLIIFKGLFVGSP